MHMGDSSGVPDALLVISPPRFSVNDVKVAYVGGWLQIFTSYSVFAIGV